MKRGSTGDAVRGVQEVIKFHDQSDGEAPPVHVDGVFGAAPTRSCAASSRPSARAADGIVGPITWRALVSGMLAG